MKKKKKLITGETFEQAVARYRLIMKSSKTDKEQVEAIHKFRSGEKW